MARISGALAAALVLVTAAAFGQDSSPPKISVLVNGVATDGSRQVTVKSIDDLSVGIVDAEGAASIQSVTMTDATGATQSLTVNTTAAGLSQPLAVSIVDGKSNFEIVKDTCSGQKLGPSTDPSGTCSVQVRALATDNGTVTGTLRIAHPSKSFDVPLTATVRGMAQGLLTVSADQSCTANRQQSVDCGTFTITNAGGFAVKSIQVVKGGDNPDNFAYTSDCPDRLEKAATCTIKAKAVGLVDNLVYKDTIGLTYVSEGTGSWTGKTLATGTRANAVTVTGWTARIAFKDAVGGGMDVAGPGNPAYGAQRRFSVLNSGEIASGTLSVSMLGADFQLTANTCDGQPLAAAGTCTIDVRPTAKANGSLSGTLRVSVGAANTDLPLSGIAQGWKPALLAFVGADGNAMDVDGPGAPAYGATRSFTVTNSGDLPTQAIAVTLGANTNFELIGSNSCANAALGAAETCSVSVRPKSSAAGTYSTTLRVTQGSNTADLGLSGTARKFAPPALTLAATDGNATLMDVVGPGAPAYGLPVTFTLKNDGDFKSSAIAFSLTNTTNFAFGTGGTCVSGTTRLDGGASCTIVVRPLATDNGTLVGALNVTGDNNPSVALNGTSVGFRPATLEFVDSAGYGMDVVGPGTPAYGNPKTFWIRNAGDLPSKPVQVALASLTNFEITSQNCGVVLDPAETCSVTVRPKAAAAGQISSKLTATQGAQSVSLDLDGRATAFAPASLVLAAVNGNPTGMIVTGPGNPATGSTVTFKVSNAGDFPSQKLSFSLSNGTNFAVTGGSCVSGTTQLGGGANCTVDVTAQAAASGTFVGEFKVLADNQPKFSMSGTATNFAPALLAFLDANGSGMDVVGPGMPALGLERSFTVKNTGELASAALSAGLTSTANFDITAQTCAGATLAGGATCTITVRPKTSVVGAYAATLRVTQGANTVDLPLTGTGSNFAPANLLVAVTSGSASEMNVVGPGAPAYGGAITATITNTGDFRSDTLALALTNSTNFEFVAGGTCINGSTQLDGKASCTVKLRPKASATAAIAGSLTVTANNSPTLALSGAASNFTPALVVFVSASGSGMDVLGPGAPAYGTTRTFTVRNDGELPSGALTVDLSSSDSFSLASGGTCVSGTTSLAKGATCTVNVQPKAYGNGALSATLNVTQNGTTTSLGLSGAATRFDGANLVVAATGGNVSAMNVVGPGNPALGSVAELTVTNTGDFASAALGFSLSNPTNFQFVSGGTCVSGATSLAGRASCTLKVQPKATADGAFTGELRVSGNNSPVVGMTGTASNFNPADLVVSSGSGSGFDVVGPGTPAFGLEHAFTIKNQGELASGTIAVSLTNTTNFDITTQTCAGASLAGGATCSVSVRPKAGAAGTYTGILRITQSGKTTDQVLTGTASKFAPASLVLAASSGNPSAMNVIGPGNPAYGTTVAVTVTNIGDYTASPLAFGLTNGTNFEFASGSTCVAGSTQLAGGASCTINVRSKATATMSFAGELSVTSDNKPSMGLSGTASNFNPPALAFVGSSGSGMDVIGPGSPAYGSARSFTVTNLGELTSGQLAVSINNGSNFDIVSETCSSAPLGGAKSCSVSVRPKASASGSISTTLRVTDASSGSIDQALSGTASGFSPANLVVSTAGGNPTAMNVTGPGSPAYGAVVAFTVQNNGDFPSAPLNFLLTNTSNFEIATGGTCVAGTTQLTKGASCTVNVRPKASASGSISGEFQVVANNNPVVGLSGTAANFTPSTLVFVSASGAGMDVTGPGNPAYGVDRSFTVQNAGELTSGTISVSLTNTINFEVTAQSCNGSTLDKGASCTVTVRPKATAAGTISGTLRIAEGGKRTDLALTGTATSFAPGTLTVAATAGNVAAMNVTGPGNPAYSDPVTLTITNGGDFTSDVLQLSLTNSTNFEFVSGGTCISGATTLAGKASCTILVRSKASANGSFTGEMRITANNNPVVGVSGTASSFTPATLVYVSASGSGMDVIGPGSPAYGTSRQFTVRNDGEMTSGAISVALTDTTNFDITAQTCSGKTLARAATCTVTVRPKASAAGAMASTLRVTQNGDNSDLLLTGTASKFAPADLQLSVVSGNPTAMNVSGPGSPAYGNTVTFKVQNNGDFASDRLSFVVTNTANFQIISGGTCVTGSTQIAGGDSCTILVRPKATASGTYSGELQITANNSPVAGLSGTASNFTPANLVFVAASGAGMDVSGPGSPAYGTERTFTVQNAGELASSAVTVSLTSVTNFDITAQTCGGATIAGGATCTITVRPKAIAAGSMSSTLRVTQNGRNTDLALSGIASHFAPTTLVIAATSGDPTAMSVDGPGNPAYGSTVTFTITNTGDQTSSTLALGLTNSTNFEFVAGGTCTSGSTTLPGGSSCTANVRPKASANGPLSGFLTVTANNNPSVALGGTASNFRPAALVFVSADGSGMDVTGPGSPAYGSERSFTVKNNGDLASGPITVALTSATNFEVSSQTCAGATLAGGSTCTVGVRPKASAAGTIASTLRLTQNGLNTDLALSGAATHFDPGSLTLTATSGDPSHMDVVGPGNPAYGSTVTFTVTNTGDFSSDVIKYSLSNTASFELVNGGTCVSGTTSLAGRASCTIQVRPKATDSGSYAGSLSVTGNNNPVAALAGKATGFKPAQIVFVNPNSTGMDVVGPGTPAFGNTRTFTIQNSGDQVSAKLSFRLTSASFQVLGDGTCADGATLAGGATCTVNVRSQASANGSLDGWLAVDMSGVEQTSVHMTGTASGFDPCATNPAAGTACADGSVFLGYAGGKKVFGQWNRVFAKISLQTGYSTCSNDNSYGRNDWIVPNLDQLWLVYGQWQRGGYQLTDYYPMMISSYWNGTISDGAKQYAMIAFPRLSSIQIPDPIGSVSWTYDNWEYFLTCVRAE